MLIRKYRALNNLLYDNQDFIDVLFNSHKENGKFNLVAAQKMFSKLEFTSPEMIKKCFVSSLMTVIDEGKKVKEYMQLLFCEFLEMFCRIALFQP